MKRIWPQLFLASLVLAFTASHAFASSISTDDPERCGERGATVHRTVGALTAPAPSIRPATPLTIAPSRKVVPAPIAVRKQPAAKPARVASPKNAPAAPTPGMGILLKMANGATGGDVTWSPSKPADNSTGASWIL